MSVSVRIYVDAFTAKPFDIAEDGTVEQLHKLMATKLDYDDEVAAKYGLYEKKSNGEEIALQPQEKINNLLNRFNKSDPKSKFFWRKNIKEEKPVVKIEIEESNYTPDPNTPDWLRLQRRIFTRWVNQKVSKRGIQVKDAVTGLSNGLLLVNLIEVLSEKEFKGKLDLKPKMRPNKLDNCNSALKFTWESGVTMKSPTSPEALVDADEKGALALIWAIVLKHTRIGEEGGEQLNAKDALLLWVKNQTASYNIKIESFKKSFQDGLALCALIHKVRPKDVPWNELNKDTANRNLNLAMDLAEKWFGLERYISPEDIPKLDENSMMMYLTDYYIGLSELRKLDLASRRISKVIKFTTENDARKQEYIEKAKVLQTKIAQAQALLDDKIIDNTLSGAKLRLDKFNNYKSKDKNEIISGNLSLEGIFNPLVIRLQQHGRVPFVPPPGLSLGDFEKSIAQLERCEQQRSKELHAELNRQIRLKSLDENRHHSRFMKLQAWISEKEAYLKRKEHIESVSAAQLQLKFLDAFEKESNSVSEQSITILKNLGKELIAEKYEKSAEIQNRETTIDNGMASLKTLSQAKKPVLEDDLTREKFKEQVRLLVSQHSDQHKQIELWLSEKTQYLSLTETIKSISEASTQLSLLEKYQKENKAFLETSVTEHKKLAETILGMQHKSQYSEYSYEKPNELKQKVSFVEEQLKKLADLAVTKKKNLELALKKEEQKENLRLEFSHLAGEFARWTKDTTENLELEGFGFSLEEVESYQASLNSSNTKIKAEAARARAEFIMVYEEMKTLQVENNPYTSLKIEDLDHSLSNLESALENRNQNFKKELERQRANDALCKSFAELVDSFSSWVNNQKSSIASSTQSLVDQLKNVESALQSYDAENKLQIIKKAQSEIESKNIAHNRHTTLTALDVEVLYEQFKIFLQKKKAILEEELEHERTRGISEQIFKEIEENFKQFDADKSGSIDKNELKACLYSLGEEKTPSEIESIMKKYGVNGEIHFEKFREFMIEIYGDTDTKEQILAGFQLINRGNSSVTLQERMQLFMSTNDIEYIKSTAPKKDQGYDYVQWTENVFSR